jgi:proteasome lid subunit RPN8/RPN11
MVELALAATEGFNRVPRGGVEIGGVLFGTRGHDAVKILAHRALACEYASGPSFTLSDHDRRTLETLLASSRTDRDLSGMQPVGWYHTHTRSEILLSEKDLELYQRYFPELWQIALVLRPHRFDPVRAGFFFREPDGTVHATSTRHEFVVRLDAGKPAMRAPEDGAPVEKVPVPLEVADPEPAGLEPPPQPEPEILRWSAPPDARVHSVRRWIWSVAIVALLVAAALFWVGSSRNSTEVSLHVLDLGGQLRIEWSCNPRVVQQSENGSLEIEDGSRKVLSALSREQLRAGSITYTRATGNVLARLTLRGTDETTRVQMARFLGSPVASAPLAIGASEQPAPPKPAETVHAPREREHEAQREATVEEHVRNESVQRTPVVSASPPRKLVLPAASIPSPAEPLVLTPPAITGNTPPPITTFIPRLPVPTPSPAPAKAADQGPRAGKIIWTGKLVRRGTIQIVANHASKGHVTGSLPGTPIRVQVFPAELTQDGLRLFTSDPKSVGAPEAPGAQNGWNRTVYVLSPRQASDITIVEAPGQQNAWSRLTLRAERGDHAIIVLHWERIPTASAPHGAGEQ